MIRTYAELMNFGTFKDRFLYLSLDGIVGIDTFGFDRYLNQDFYRSAEWKRIRHKVILRDNGCDLGIADRPIFDKIIIHHMNPILPKDIIEATDYLLNPEYLICTSLLTHNALHYGNIDLISNDYIERKPGDTKLW